MLQREHVFVATVLLNDKQNEFVFQKVIASGK